MRLRYGRHVLLGGGGFGLLGAAGFGVFWQEVRLTRRAIPRIGHAPLPPGEYGAEHAGPPLRLAMLGDSSAAGVGCEDALDTPGAQLAQALADRGRRVLLDVLAVSGSLSKDLDPQVSRCLVTAPDVAVICIGANDVVNFVHPDRAVPHLVDAVARLHEAGVAVVVATCPDFGALGWLPQPLGEYARRVSRRMARAQLRAVLAEGAVPVEVGNLLGPVFAARAAEMFSHDRFHPSPAGYREAARLFLYGVLAALDEPLPEVPDPTRQVSASE